ncbi:hypothetical protein JHK87_056268 [Glycine soja]|nr:hypothetical protein JHK87_056268 [Glycine soja]
MNFSPFLSILSGSSLQHNVHPATFLCIHYRIPLGLISFYRSWTLMMIFTGVGINK